VRAESAGVTVDSQLKPYRKAYRATKGWFFWEAAAVWDSLLCFQARSGVSGPMLEIGVHHGLSAALLLLHAAARGERVVLVDRHPQDKKVHRTFRRLPEAARHAAIRVEADSRNLRSVAQVTAHRGEYRWIHIDGEHSSAALRNDLEIADEMLGEEGILCVDDIFNVLYPHLTETLFQMARENPDRYRVFLFGYHKAYLVRPQHLRRHLDHCPARLLDDLEAARIRATLSKKTTEEEFPAFSISERKRRWGRLLGPDGGVC
jgi:predicted O-methyltransferase YrrM